VRALRDRRPVAVRRHAVRLVKRSIVLATSDVVAIVALQGLAQWLAETTTTRAALAFHSALGGAAAVILLLSLVITGTYSRAGQLNRTLRLGGASAITAVVTLWPLLPTYGASFFSAVALGTAAMWLVLSAERQIAERFLRSVWPGPDGATPSVVIDRAAAEHADLRSMSTDSGGDYKLLATLTVGRVVKGSALLSQLAHLIQANAAEAVIVACPLPDDIVREVLDVSLASGCEFLYPARSVKIAGRRPMLVWHQDEPFFELGAPLLKAQALILKRAVDIIGATLGIILLAPFLALIAILIKIDSPGPIFFWQDRAGMGGRRFRMLKFRTMRHGADAEKARLAHLNHTGDARLFKIPNDPRVTNFGAWLRRWSIDELPQCWNVLVGTMSLVGPRPFFEADLENYEDHHFRRLDAKPGITGLWQVSGRSDVVDFEEVVRYDREYIEHWSPWLDLKIIGKTIPAVFHRTGAY